MARMRASECLLLQSDMATRVALLMDEYRHFFTDVTKLGMLLDCLVGMHSRERIGEWKALAAAGDWPGLVARLLEEHYDRHTCARPRTTTRVSQTRGHSS